MRTEHIHIMVRMVWICVPGNSGSFYGDYRELFCFEVNLKFVFNGVISFKIKQLQNLSVEPFNDDFSVYRLGTGPAAQQLVVWGPKALVRV